MITRINTRFANMNVIKNVITIKEILENTRENL